jgi:hypothetical protein
MERIQMVAVILGCMLGLCACETYPHDKATALVTAPYPGKEKPGACKPYADALCKALARHHIPAWRVYYTRNNMCGPNGHAMVVYKDAGSYWYADNEFPYPNKCEGTTPMEWAQEREGVWLAGGSDLYTGASFMGPNAAFANTNMIVGAYALRGNGSPWRKTHEVKHTAKAVSPKTQPAHKQDMRIAARTARAE